MTLRSRFGKEMDDLAKGYTASIPFDRRLYEYDIAGSIAHARMLAKQGIISDRDAELIIMGLTSIREEIEQDRFEFKKELEDIHMNIEVRLIAKVGDPGAKLHTARSRNDQVALDMRLFTKDAIAETLRRLKALQKALLDQAQENKKVIMPGYTHLQRAQPILLAHHVLAYFEMFQRDVERFKNCLERTDVLPLGSGALAGVSYDIDRDFLAKELGFSKVSANSLDAVSDRDFVIEYQAAASLAMMHLSRLAEEITLWSSAEFGFIEIDDAFASGSSIMPQKKNPDVAELARAKTGRVYGHLMAFLTTMKALPLSYNRDMQEDKEGLFDSVDTLLSTLEVFAAMIACLRVKSDRMRQAVEQDYTLATDIADYLVRKGIPFREAHTIVGKLVRYASELGRSLTEIELSEYRRFCAEFDNDVKSITVESSLAARGSSGGTAPEEVEKALAAAKKKLNG
ncbi:MAG TPA: argininosuccinate lyase [Dehalococcoidia bacterium]|nr:argininosuccinate lyase [Dehalococcoidia bacterium]